MARPTIDELKTMTIQSFEPPKQGSILEALDAIYEAGGKAWDKVKEPEKKIAEMRGK